MVLRDEFDLDKLVAEILLNPPEPDPVVQECLGLIDGLRLRAHAMGEAGVQYLERYGLSICPYVTTESGDKVTTIKWKPLQTSRLTADQILSLFADKHHWNNGLGMVTGYVSGIVIVDADDEKAEAWVQSHCPPTPWVVETGRPRKGRHHGYRHPGASATIKTETGLFGMHLDIRGDAGFCVLPPSVHHSGKTYRFSGGVDFPVSSLKELPVFNPKQWGWPERAKPRTYAPVTPIDMACEERIARARAYLSSIPPAVSGRGGHDHTLKITLHIGVGFDLDGPAALQAMRPWNSRCSPPWDESDLMDLVEGARRKGAGCIGFHLTDAQKTKKTNQESTGVDPLQESEPTIQFTDAANPRSPEVDPPDALTTYLAPLRARAAGKRALAETVDPLVAELAGRAIRRGHDLYARFKAHLKVQGITRRGSHCGTRSHALVHTANGESMVRSVSCRGVSCSVCGPLVLASKAAAIADMPLVGKDHRLAGAPLSGRTIYLSTILPSDQAAWTKAFRRAAKEMSVFAHTEREALRAKTDISDGGSKTNMLDAHAYLMCDPQDGTGITVLSTLRVRLKGHDLPVTLVGADTIRSIAIQLVVATYTRDPNVAERVRGRISSSHNLPLRPDTIYAMSRPSSWVLEQDNTVSPSRAAEVMSDEGVAVTAEAAGDGLVERAVASAVGPMRDPKARRRIMDRLAVESRDHSPSPRFIPVGVDLSEIDALLDQW